MKNVNINSLIFMISIFILIYSFILISKKFWPNNNLKIIRRRKARFFMPDPPPEFILLPSSPIAIKNLSYCPYYTPKDKEFSKMPIKYKHGISIIITAYKMEKYIKESLDSISNQTWFKERENWEIIVGVDGCNTTLKYLQRIIKNYKNLHVFMMEENKGTYITTNSMMSIAKYDNLLRFDADDVMLPYLVETLMNISESRNPDRIMFMKQNFGKTIYGQKWAYGQIFMKHWVFDYFGGFMPWRCEGDSEFIRRVDKFIKVQYINKILFKKRVHDSNLTVLKKTKMKSLFRKWHVRYIREVSQKIKNINNAVIIKITDEYIEIFPDSII